MRTYHTAVLIILTLCIAMQASAETYYADIEIDIDSSGDATFKGLSNHPLLSEGVKQSYTSKKGSYWLFNLTLPKDAIFSDYVYSVTLPAGATVNYVKADSFRIGSSGERIRISGSGSNKEISIVIQYQLGSAPGSNMLLYAAGLLILVAVAGFYMARRRKNVQFKAEPLLQKRRPPLKPQ